MMRAFSHCLCTVRSETPRIAAISAKEKPQKNFRSTIWASAASVPASVSSASPIPESSSSSTGLSAGSVPIAVISIRPVSACGAIPCLKKVGHVATRRLSDREISDVTSA